MNVLSRHWSSKSNNTICLSTNVFPSWNATRATRKHHVCHGQNILYALCSSIPSWESKHNGCVYIYIHFLSYPCSYIYILCVYIYIYTPLYSWVDQHIPTWPWHMFSSSFFVTGWVLPGSASQLVLCSGGSTAGVSVGHPMIYRIYHAPHSHDNLEDTLWVCLDKAIFKHMSGRRLQILFDLVNLLDAIHHKFPAQPSPSGRFENWLILHLWSLA